MSPEDSILLAAKLKALNTIARSSTREAITGFVEEIRNIPGCAEKLKKLEVMEEQAFFDDEMAITFINSF